jgi:hypothetical protein
MDDKDAQRRRRREETKERISDDFTGCENSGTSGKLIPCRRIVINDCGQLTARRRWNWKDSERPRAVRTNYGRDEEGSKKMGWFEKDEKHI